MSVMLGLIHLDLANLCVNQKKKKRPLSDMPKHFPSRHVQADVQRAWLTAAQLEIKKQIIILHTIVNGVREGCAPQVWMDPILCDMKINAVEPKSEIAHKSQTRKNSSRSRGIQTLV